MITFIAIGIGCVAILLAVLNLLEPTLRRHFLRPPPWHSKTVERDGKKYQEKWHD